MVTHKLSIKKHVAKVVPTLSSMHSNGLLRRMYYLIGPFNAGPNLTPALITPISNCAEFKKVFLFI